MKDPTSKNMRAMKIYIEVRITKSKNLSRLESFLLTNINSLYVSLFGKFKIMLYSYVDLF